MKKLLGLLSVMFFGLVMSNRLDAEIEIEEAQDELFTDAEVKKERGTEDQKRSLSLSNMKPRFFTENKVYTYPHEVIRAQDVRAISIFSEGFDDSRGYDHFPNDLN